jgi:hypothetical protein
MLHVAAFASSSALLAQTPKAAAPTPGQPPAGVVDMSKLPRTLKVPETFEGLFGERDTRAVNAIGYLRCMQGTINALRAGVLGQVRRDYSIACVQQGKEWRGVFGELTETGIIVRLQFALRGERGAVTTDAIDTARVNAAARALLRGLSVPLPGQGKYEYTPVILPQPTFVEIWFLPVPAKPTSVVVGGDSLIQMSVDGLRELGHGKTSPPIRAISVPLSGKQWTLESSEARLPSISELVVAHMALDLIPEVHIRTKQYDSALTRAGRWTHRARSSP